jgi:hypothetical protein
VLKAQQVLLEQMAQKVQLVSKGCRVLQALREKLAHKELMVQSVQLASREKLGLLEHKV